MKIYCSYMGQAWLLSQDGDLVDVLHHPSEKFEFDSIIDVIQQYGDAKIQLVVEDYMDNPTELKHAKLLDYYNNTWCKVRTWGTFQEDITFRITSTGFNWYPVIVDFLLLHPQFQNSNVTIESDRMNGARKTYINSEQYAAVIDPKNESVFASKLITH